MHTRRSFTAALLSAAAPLAGDPAWLSVEEASELIRRRKLSPVELTKACLERIERLNPKLNAFITVTAESALAAARAREREKPRGPLHGIPVGVKDLFDTAGVLTTAASRHWDKRIPDKDAAAVEHLHRAGAVLLGKLNMDEFAYNFTSETSAFGPVRNPWDPRRSPGGSSGGSAVAVAAGMCLASLGSDTGGSIRLPAALCGVTGMKPSYGLVSTEGAAVLAWSLDHVGPLCRSARDAAFVLEAIAARPLSVETQVRALRLGTPRALFYEGLDPHVARLVGEAVHTLAKITAGARDVTLPSLPFSPSAPELLLTYVQIIAAEAHAYHEERLRKEPQLFHAGTRRSLGLSEGMSTGDYIRARLEMDRLRRSAGELFRSADLLLTPAAPAPAFELDSKPSLVFLRNLAPWNLYGLPSISIPCGFTPEGLPAGLQITGPPGRDDLVLALAIAYQRATSWHTRRPPV